MVNPDLSDDDISITSTAPSEYQEEYEVEDVLAENKPDNGSDTYYLVKWANYPLERCTWEPEESFCDEQTLRDWRAKKEAIAQSKIKPFDVDALMERINALEEARALRKSRRRAKRIRLGIPVSPSESEESEEFRSLDGFIVDDEEEEDETPKKRKAQGNGKRRFSQVDGGSESPNSLFDEVIDITESPKRTKLPPSSSTSLAHTKKKRQLEAPGASLRQQASVTDKTVTSSSRASRPGISLRPPISRFASSAIPASRGRSSAMGPRPTLALKARRQGAGAGADDPRAYRLLSTQRRQEKFNRRDRVPDITQLELRRPSDWLNQPPAQMPVLSAASKRTDATDSLFVEQYSPVQEQASLHARDHPREVTRLEDRSVGDRPQEPNEPTNPRPPISNTIPQPFRRCTPGDILVTLRLNGMEGDAIIRTDGGMRGLVKRQLLELSVRRRLLIDFQETCSVGEFKRRREEGYNIEHYHCWAVGFEDTKNTLNEMVKYLRAHDLAAVWHHPLEETQLVLLAYATGSPNWDILHKEYTVPPEHGLRIVIRGTLPPLRPLKQSRPLIDPPQQLHTQRPMVRHAIPAGPFDIENSDSAPCLLAAPPQTQSASAIQPDFKDFETLLTSYPKDNQLTKFFKEVFGINFKDLCFVRTKKGSEKVATFYLWFPDSFMDEFELVKRFLQENKVATIFSNQQDDWGRFSALAGVSGMSGTILFHQAFFNYEDVPELRKFLQQAPFNLFNISLRRPIEGTANSHLQQIFPRGGVVLMTEDFIIRETSNALTVMEWFRGMFKTSTDWKIFFRPNVQRWLFEQFDKCKDDKIFKIYCHVRHLIPEYPQSHFNYGKRYGSPEDLDGLTDDEGQHHPFVSPAYLPNYNSQTRDENDADSKGLDQEQKNADCLIEHFALWTLNNCHRHRKFFVLTHFKPQPRWEKWQHITVTTGEKFIKNLNMPPKGSNASTTARNDPRRRPGQLTTKIQTSTTSQSPSTPRPPDVASPSISHQPHVTNSSKNQDQRVPTSPKGNRPSLDPRLSRHAAPVTDSSTAHQRPPSSSNSMPPPRHPLPLRPPRPPAFSDKWIRRAKNWIESHRPS